jgi:hypothetical protein
MITSTVNWRIVNVEVAARMAAETMSASGRAGEVSADITKLRQDVLKQAIASLAGFVGGVNYSNTFHMSAASQGMKDKQKSTTFKSEAQASLIGDDAELSEDVLDAKAEEVYIGELCFFFVMYYCKSLSSNVLEK